MGSTVDRPALRLSASALWRQSPAADGISAKLRGTVFAGGVLEARFRSCHDLSDPAVARILHETDGLFALVASDGRRLLAAVDRVRSILCSMVGTAAAGSYPTMGVTLRPCSAWGRRMLPPMRR